jgi:hypothetical protein
MKKTDKELFREYLESTVPEQGQTVFQHYLAGFECFGIDTMLKGVMRSIVKADPEPDAELDFLMNELRDLIDNLAHVRKGFVAFKTMQSEVPA